MTTGVRRAADQLFRVDGRVALVTGGSRGLGRAMAVGLAAAGATVMITSRSGHAPETERAIHDLGGEVAVRSAGSDDAGPGPQLVQDVIDQFGTLDILVNNAGTNRRASVMEFTMQDWRAVLEVNLTATWALSQAAAKHMVERGHGKIVNVASLLSFQGGSTVPAYAAAKHAVAGLTRAMCNELAAHRINVNAIVPGYMATDMNAALLENESRNSEIRARIPAGRWGQPEDLVGAAVFLSSRASDYVNGHLLVVDGGWLAR